MFGGDNTTFAQLWYSPQASSFPQEQFYCGADSCTQVNDTSSGDIVWSCSNLKCSCLSGAAFCSDPLDLTEIIDGLEGTLVIDCSASGTDCSFKHATLNSLFGQSGLALSGCTFGECVSSQVIQAFSSDGQTTSGSDGLSGGVIGGLAVVGAILLALAALLVFGLIGQKKARRGGASKLEDSEPAGLYWSQLGYALPVSYHLKWYARFHRKGKASPRSAEADGQGEKSALSSSAGLKTGKLIIDGITGSLSHGGFMAIMGPSGAGKS